MEDTELKVAESWIFDLDNTLYRSSTNLFGQISDRMRGFIADFLGVDEKEAHRVQKKYFREYGTTLRGLMHHHDINPYRFMEHVHDINLGAVVPDPNLEQALGALTGRKIIYTNASAEHARRVIGRLGVAGHFEAVFDIADAGFIPKPEPEPYMKLIERHGIDPKKSVMVEDMARNLRPAAALGMTTVWVRTEADWARQDSDAEYIDHKTDNLAEWLSVLTA